MAMMMLIEGSLEPFIFYYLGAINMAVIIKTNPYWYREEKQVEPSLQPQLFAEESATAKAQADSEQRDKLRKIAAKVLVR